MEEKNDYNELKERMLRIAAEFENYKKRVKDDSDRARSTGKAEVIRDLLPVLDEFELALITIESAQDKGLAKGIEMVYSNLLETLKREGLTEIDTKGVFDPYKHEIMLSRPDGKRKPGTIIEVMKKGYMLDKIMLRPASVIVSKEEEEKK
ncbi:MAG TPA: nucleotide exchange factor GrpE [Candidatus Acidoferrum sp.]|nr:nucleotide exchange factor GrpE [Candidatus Acidoferrum sp.]